MNKKRSPRINRRLLTGVNVFLSVVLILLLVLAFSLERTSTGGEATTDAPDATTQDTQSSNQPAVGNTDAPTTMPTTTPSTAPTIAPTTVPTTEPTTTPTTEPTTAPTTEPATAPTTEPTTIPTTEPTTAPTTEPTTEPVSTQHVHAYNPTEQVKATCQAIGYTIYTCSCGDLYVADETPMGDHEYETQVVSPTTETEGYTLYMCIHCDYEYRDHYTEKLPEATSAPEEDVLFNLVHGLQVTDIGSYSGPFLEDGSGKTVENVLMIQVRNTSEEDLQYATIQLTESGGTATFTVSTLPAGGSVILLEQNEKAYTGGDYSVATVDNVVFYTETLSTQSDKIRLQGLDGALNVTNISGAPISGTIEIYYKNYIDGQLYGGITYVARVTGGLAAGETRQIMTGHFSVAQSIIMFIRIVE